MVSMAKLPQPDLESVAGRAALKSVLKWEIQTLLNRLAETGEEALLLTASLEDDKFSELGSNRGQNFLQLSNLEDIKTQFLTYCKACFADHTFGSTQSGEVTLDAQSLLNTNNKRPKLSSKSRKRKHFKSRHSDISADKKQYSDDNPPVLQPYGNPVSEATNGDTGTGHMTSDRTHGKRPSSRRKRTPKKVLLNTSSYHSNSDTDDMAEQSCAISIKQEPVWQDEYETVTGNQSTEFNQAGSPSSSYLQTQFAQSAGNQSADSDTSSSKDGFQLSSSVPKKMFSILGSYGEPANAGNSSSGNSNSLKVKLKLMGPKKKKVKKEPGTSLFDNQSEAGQSEGEATQMYTSNSKGLKSSGKLDLNADNITPEDLDLMRFQSPVRPPGKGFKAAASDEQPMETAILDAAKLGVGRYQCLWCALIVRDRHDLKRHLRTHTKQKPYQCEQCNRKFSRKWDLENHLKRHQEESLNERAFSLAPVKVENLSESELHMFWLESMKAKLDLAASANENAEDGAHGFEDDIGGGDDCSNSAENMRINVGDCTEGMDKVLDGTEDCADVVEDGTGAVTEVEGTGAVTEVTTAVTEGEGTGAVTEVTAAVTEDEGAVTEGTGAVTEVTGAVTEGTGAVTEGEGTRAVTEVTGAVTEGTGAVTEGEGTRAVTEVTGAVTEGTGAVTEGDGDEPVDNDVETDNQEDSE